ncbi:MAG: heat-shock protein [Desulfobulbus propionicus]|nr:MAG: heat-shock protein [Desulfobulbus propionicus]
MGTTKDLTTTPEHKTVPQRGRLPVTTPAVDIYENQDTILVYAEMPGVQKEDIMVHIDHGRLFVAGERRAAPGDTATWEEFGATEFRRAFSIPQTIDVDKVEAHFKDGILELHLAKSAAAKRRQIAIQNG